MRKVLLGITGGIAAYKTPDIVRRLRESGCAVRVVMTEGAKAFITPLTLQTVSGHPVPEGIFDGAFESAMGHIELARWADVICIAPATADSIARLTHGHANDLLTTLCLATTAPIVIAPAMNQQMWQAVPVQENIQRLTERGVTIIGPAVGAQACGEFGPGRMVEPEAIVQHLLASSVTFPVNIVITAGPTREKIDPVRYLSNYSSGKMGFALAAAAQMMGARVTLIAGPCALATPTGVQRIDVDSAREMHDAVMQAMELEPDVFIATAAVADYHAVDVAEQKIKKTADSLSIHLQQNPDILKAVAASHPAVFRVGFAAETENLLDNAKAKRLNKQADMIIANQVGKAGIGFDADDNAVTVISENDMISLPKQAKTQLAKTLMALIQEQKDNLHELKKSTVENTG